jgi:division/cell wall cluster transcriptional repressor MraZ
MNEGQHKGFLNGRFQHSVDKAGRVSVPAKWWRDRKGESFMVVRWPLDAPKCLKVLPPELYEKILDGLGGGQLTNEEDEKFVRAVGASSEIQEIDESGRMVLRPDLCESVGIKGEAVLVGCVRYFEVWNEKSLQAELPATLQAASASAKQKGI